MEHPVCKTCGFKRTRDAVFGRWVCWTVGCFNPPTNPFA